MAIFAFLAYQVGLLEYPPFVLQREIVLAHQEILAIMATSKERINGKNVEKLFNASKKAVETLQDHEDVLNAGAKFYEVGNLTSSLQVGLYFDDPHETENPRWAMGWVVKGRSLHSLNSKMHKMQKASGLSSESNPIRVVRFGGQGVNVLSARIPWRNKFTPMIAPMLHWGRGFRKYEEYKKKHPDVKEDARAIALEVYVSDYDKNKYKYIEYSVLFGGVTHTWKDAFPESMVKEEFESVTTAFE